MYFVKSLTLLLQQDSIWSAWSVCFPTHCGPGSSVGIATGYVLDVPGIESRWGRNFPPPVQSGRGAHTTSCTMGTGSFPVVKSGRGVTLTPQPLLEPWSRKSRAILLLPLWAVRFVQSLSACTSVHFTSTFTSRIHCVCFPYHPTETNATIREIHKLFSTDFST